MNKKPILIYDGDCTFCRNWINRWQKISGESVDYATYQDVAHIYPQISSSQFKTSVQLIDPDLRVSTGAEAVFKALAYNPKSRYFFKLYKYFPGFAFFSEFLYKLIARNRHVFSKLSIFFLT